MGIDVALTGRPQSDKWEIAKLGTNTHAGTSISAGYADTVTISHNLGYIPAFLVYAEAPGYLYDWGGTLKGKTILPITYVLTGTTLIYLTARADATNLYIDFINVSSSTQNLSAWTWTFQYYIFKSFGASS